MTEQEVIEKVKGLVCDGCGGPLKPLATVDNSGNPTHWPVCEQCSKYCWGVGEQTFRICREMFNRGLRAYHHNPDASVSSQISGLRNTLFDVTEAIKTIESQNK